MWPKRTLALKVFPFGKNFNRHYCRGIPCGSPQDNTGEASLGNQSKIIVFAVESFNGTQISNQLFYLLFSLSIRPIDNTGDAQIRPFFLTQGLQLANGMIATQP